MKIIKLMRECRQKEIKFVGCSSPIQTGYYVLKTPFIVITASLKEAVLLQSINQ